MPIRSRGHDAHLIRGSRVPDAEIVPPVSTPSSLAPWPRGGILQLQGWFAGERVAMSRSVLTGDRQGLGGAACIMQLPGT